MGIEYLSSGSNGVTLRKKQIKMLSVESVDVRKQVLYLNK